MRLHLTIRPRGRNLSIPINYNYYLSAAIYRWIEQSSPAYSNFLHEHGYSLEGTTKRFKHFCFSYLKIPHREVNGARVKILSPYVFWQIGMPVEETLKHLVVGIFEKQEFFIETNENVFSIEQVEALPEPEWKNEMKFKMLSPTTVSIPEERNGKILPHYLRPDDPRLSEAIRKNILNKYNSLYDPGKRFPSSSQQQEPKETFNQEKRIPSSLPQQEQKETFNLDQKFTCTLDKKFLDDRGGPDKISKLITVKEGHDSKTKVRGFMCPITIEGNPELIKLAYKSGLGEKGSLGFGMLETVNGK